MKKTVNINFLRGEASVEVNMGYLYKSLMEAVFLKSNDDLSRFLAGVQCVIWGSLYLEATVNQVSVRLFGEPIHPTAKVKRLMWKLAERAELDKKVEALAEMFEDDEDASSQHIKNLKKLIRIRNRLVHFKEPPTPVDASFLHKPTQELMGLKELPEQGVTWGQLNDAIDAGLPNPEIVHSVVSMSLDERRHEIIQIGKWLHGLRET